MEADDHISGKVSIPAPDAPALKRARRHVFWDSEAGKRHSDFRRLLAGLWLSLSEEPFGKKSSRSNRLRTTRDLMDADSLPWRVESKYGRWPRMRAAVGLDMHFSSKRRQPPRIDKIVKWILDELGDDYGNPLVYRDDSQVKWLFARLDSRLTAEESEPRIMLHAQTSSTIKANVRRAIELDPGWNSRRAIGSSAYGTPDAWVPDDSMDYQPLDEESPFAKEWSLRIPHERAYKRQQDMLRAVDSFAASVVITYSLEKRGAPGDEGGTANALRYLASAPHYVYDLGRMPTKRGDTQIFVETARNLLAGAVDRSLGLPLRTQVGITIFYVENRTYPRDLDNLFLTIVPLVITQLAPPSDDRNPWIAADRLRLLAGDDFRVDASASGISFIEGVSLNIGSDEQFPEGTVIVALSNGARHESWWEMAQSYASDATEHGEPWDSFD